MQSSQVFFINNSSLISNLSTKFWAAILYIVSGPVYTSQWYQVPKSAGLWFDLVTNATGMIKSRFITYSFSLHVTNKNSILFFDFATALSISKFIVVLFLLSLDIDIKFDQSLGV